MPKAIRMFGSTLVVLALAGQAQVIPAAANDSSINMGAHGPEPLDVRGGRESPIRMVEEELIFRFGKWETKVQARFVFENTLADSTVRQLSGFPDVHAIPDPFDGGWEESSDLLREFDREYGHSNPLRDLVTLIDGRRVESSAELGYVDICNGDYLAWVPADTVTNIRVRWYVVELVIPPKERVTLERRYTVDNGNSGACEGTFTYVTFTGGPWQGTIGKLTATVLLEDGLTLDKLTCPRIENRQWVASPWCGDQNDWRVGTDNRLTLVWTNFEPMTDLTRSGIELAWQATPEEMTQHWSSFYPTWKDSRWWPWNWFRSIK